MGPLMNFIGAAVGCVLIGMDTSWYMGVGLFLLAGAIVGAIK